MFRPLLFSLIRPVPRRALWLLLTVSSVSTPALTQAQTQPNILFIVADDQRMDAVAAFGNPLIKTPTLDKLVHEGTVLSRATCAYPVCLPSRTEMLSGRTFANAIDHASAQPPTLPALLRTAGYEAWHVGKWHMAGRPITQGFTSSRALFTESAKNPKPPMTFDVHGRPITGYRGWVFQDDEGKEFPELGVGLTPNISEQFADAAIDLISRKSDKPFFLHLNFTSPHDPRLLPKGYENAYPPDKMPLPENFQPTPDITLNTRDERLLPKPLSPDDVRAELSAYYAQISHMDAQIGRVLESLQRSGKADNTIIVFVSDHGLALGSHGLVGKQNLYDDTLLVPCILVGPGIPVNAQRAGLVYLRDISATILSLCQVGIPSEWDGQDLTPLLNGKVSQVHPYVVGYYIDESRCVRTEEWKLITYPKEKKDQLFNLRQDPLEKNNLAGAPECADVLADLHQKLLAWETTDP
uniref:sulfatase-like hydrolase/transferase n=1 Tax=Cephaloticoccus sp. TaxID=1985742 RepID=UPI004049D7A9